MTTAGTEPGPVLEHPLALALDAAGIGTAPIGLDGVAFARCPACWARGYTLRLPPAPALPTCTVGRCSPAKIADALEIVATQAPSHRVILQATAIQIREALAPDEPTFLDDLPCTDLGNARRLVARHGRDIRYVPGLGWFRWDGCHWAPDVDGALMRAAKETVDEMLGGSLVDVAAAAAITDAHERQERAAAAKRRMNHALHSQAEPRLRAMRTLAETEMTVVARFEQFDADPMAFNCMTGTIDLTTGACRAHRREDLISRLAPVTYDLEAQAPIWTRFIEEVLGGDQELVGYLRRAFGYALTARTDEQVVTLLYGAGANGKSTLLKTVRALFGNYAAYSEFATFVARARGGGARTDLVRLQGIRLVVASESAEGEQLDERLVKEMTGGEPIVARHHYQEEIEFPPVAKIWWAANHLPHVRGTDEGIWRRLRLVPFLRVIPEEQRDHALGEKLIAELPGILVWMVQGCLEWQRVGLGQVQQIADATSEYRAASDSFGRWFAEECIPDPDARLTRGAMRRAHERWCEREGERPLSAPAFTDELRRRGVAEVGGVRDGARRERGWRGVRLHVDSGRQSAAIVSRSDSPAGDSEDLMSTGVDVSTREGDPESGADDSRPSRSPL